MATLTISAGGGMAPRVGVRASLPHTSVSTTEDGSSKPVKSEGEQKEAEMRHISHWCLLVLELLKLKDYFKANKDSAEK